MYVLISERWWRVELVLIMTNQYRIVLEKEMIIVLIDWYFTFLGTYGMACVKIEIDCQSLQCFCLVLKKYIVQRVRFSYVVTWWLVFSKGISPRSANWYQILQNVLCNIMLYSKIISTPSSLQSAFSCNFIDIVNSFCKIIAMFKYYRKVTRTSFYVNILALRYFLIQILNRHISM